MIVGAVTRAGTTAAAAADAWIVAAVDAGSLFVEEAASAVAARGSPVGVAAVAGPAAALVAAALIAESAGAGVGLKPLLKAICELVMFREQMVGLVPALGQGHGEPEEVEQLQATHVAAAAVADAALALAYAVFPEPSPFSSRASLRGHVIRQCDVRRAGASAANLSRSTSPTPHAWSAPSGPQTA